MASLIRVHFRHPNDPRDRWSFEETFDTEAALALVRALRAVGYQTRTEKIDLPDEGDEEAA